MFLVYGAGNIGKVFVRKCMEKEISDLCITDSDKNLWGGGEIEGIAVREFDSIDLSEITLIVIAASVRYQDEIRKIIRKRTEEIEIVLYSDAVLIAENDILYIGRIKLSKELKAGIYSYKGLIKLFDPDSFNDLDKFMYTKKHRELNKVAHYSEMYDKFFSRYRGNKVKVLEIGIWQGGSLQMWKDYFGENAEIFGLDVNPGCKELEKENFHIFIGDQGNEEYLHKLRESTGKLDVIIDDGGHMMQQQITSFEVLFDALDDDGVYLCEDMHTSYWAEYGGKYGKKGTFIEYAKWLLDVLNEQYFESDNIAFPYRGRIKSITFCDGMVFIEKKKYGNRSPVLIMGENSNS